LSEKKAKVGNFVDMKKTELGEGAKANHLSYLGDATIARGVNIGAGTITCNYDGRQKYRTVIGEDVFLGSDTQLIAPVTIGDRSVVAAGTTVTQNVPPDSLAISRVVQVNRVGWVTKRNMLLAPKTQTGRGNSHPSQSATKKSAVTVGSLPKRRKTSSKG